MQKQLQILNNWQINKSWTLFLDRDGIINKKIENGYVKKWDDFEFLPDAISSLKVLSKLFSKIFIVTNQRGIGRGLMSEQDLDAIHKQMLSIFEKNDIHINKIYYCPHDHEREFCNCRKPAIGLALQAKKDFPDIDFTHSLMIGDAISDVLFGQNAGMKNCYIGNTIAEAVIAEDVISFDSLSDFIRTLLLIHVTK